MVNFSYVLTYLWTELADPRTRDWFVVSSPWIIPSVTTAYLYTVFKFGPRFMKNRPPFSMNVLIILYDLLQIIANGILAYYLFTTFWSMSAPIFCDPIVYSYDPDHYKLAEIMWWILVLKIFDFVETILFVLKKKGNHASMLHVYHHVTTVFLQWYATRYLAGTMAAFVHSVNCTVHVIMYSYYLLSSFGPRVRLCVDIWKSLLTVLQLIQFWGLMLYCVQALRGSCDFPKAPLIIVILDLAVNFVVFYSFYRENYSNKIRNVRHLRTDSTINNV